MLKLWHIIQGYWYWITKPKPIKEMSDKRMKICADCPDRKGAFCGLCGCVLKAKTSVPNEYCPALRWGKQK